jgi:aryl-alcohol dehydrogenase-like predicted oxidoreductase
MLLGRATPEATTRYAARHGTWKHTGFYRETPLGIVSSLGIGTYLGEMTRDADTAYVEAILTAIRGGINFIDTSLNYRNQKSERAIGQAILTLIESPKEVDRDEFAVCTKAGYLVRGATPEKMPSEDVVGGMHSMAPVFLADQLGRSRVNLGLETIDVFYLHNPETQLGFLSHEEFHDRLRLAFRFLEQAVAEQTIQFYGVATWEGFRKPHALSLTKMDEIAREIAGAGHHFRFIQLPLNLAMPEAFTSGHENLNGSAVTVLEAAEGLGITVVASASILQSRLSRDLPGEFAASLPGLSTDAQRAIQFTRSTPGVTTALVGMGHTAHVHENLGLGPVPPLTRDQYLHLFRTGR